MQLLDLHKFTITHLLQSLFLFLQLSQGAKLPVKRELATNLSA